MTVVHDSKSQNKQGRDGQSRSLAQNLKKKHLRSAPRLRLKKAVFRVR